MQGHLCTNVSTCTAFGSWTIWERGIQNTSQSKHFLLQCDQYWWYGVHTDDMVNPYQTVDHLYHIFVLLITCIIFPLFLYFRLWTHSLVAKRCSKLKLLVCAIVIHQTRKDEAIQLVKAQTLFFSPTSNVGIHVRRIVVISMISTVTNLKYLRTL